jgi:hypothetical protein
VLTELAGKLETATGMFAAKVGRLVALHERLVGPVALPGQTGSQTKPASSGVVGSMSSLIDTMGAQFTTLEQVIEALEKIA